MSSKNYSALLDELEEITDKTKLKDYHAFAYWFIESEFEGYDTQKIIDSICDGTHDKGIDAVLINDIEQKVTVIQSKYEHEGEKVQIKDSEIKLLATVKDYFKSRKALSAAIANANPATLRLMNEAFEVIHTKGYSLELIFVTTHRDAPHINGLIRDTFEFKHGEFSVYHYGKIMELFEDKLRNFTPRLGVYSLPYKDSDKAMVRTSKYNSWVLSIPLQEIRSLVNKYGDKLFRKNVRNFLGKNRCNAGILETLKNNPENFWYYNNGMCILCDEANLVVENNYVRLVNPQVINGCQTARSIERFQGDLVGDVLVRIIESKEHEFVDEITFYQNTSNPVRKRDLKSNDPLQVRLKKEFERQHWYYENKGGEEFTKMSKRYRWMKEHFKIETIDGNTTLNNEKVAQNLAAIKLDPVTAISGGSDYFFDDAYYNIFTPNMSTSNCLAPYLLHDLIIKDTYKRGEKFHRFKAPAFKNPASWYVLKFIYDALGISVKWEKEFISFFENSDTTEYKKFRNKMDKVIDEYFEIIRKTWSKSGEPNLNTYLKTKKTKQDIEKKQRTKINKLSNKVKRIFKKFVFTDNN